jgi:hypothetical protein
MGKLAIRPGSASWRAAHPVAIVCALVMLLLPAPAAALPLEVSVDRLDAEGVTVFGLQARVQAGGVVVNVQQADLPGDLTVKELRLECAGPAGSVETVCAGAPWSVNFAASGGGWGIPLRGTLGSFERTPAGWRAESSVESGPLTAAARLERKDAAVEAGLVWRNQALAGLKQLPVAAGPLHWVFAGQTSGALALHGPSDGPLRVEYELSASQLSFDSPDGRFAAADFAIGMHGSITGADSPVIEWAADITAGELLVDRFYFAFDEAGLQLRAEAVKTGDELHIRSAQLRDGRTLELEATADLDLEAPLQSLAWRIDHLELHFPGAYERYLQAPLAPLTLDGLTVTGSVLWRGSGRAGDFPEGVLDVLDLSVVDRQRERFALTGLEARLRAGASPADSSIAWRGLLLRRINLGAGQARMLTRPGEFELAEPLRLDVLGGRLSLDRMQLTLPASDAQPGSEPQIGLQASLDGMSMAQLTEALDWPRFEGRISGTIPGVSLEGGVLSVDGEITFNVFDGLLVLSGLRVERPFGVLPSLAANLDVRNIDLEQFTRAFSFGRISGRMDGYMHDLRMLDWEPVAFDAWFGTPAQQKGSNAISRQAVNHLTTIGGGGATAALSGPIMRLFSNFSYRRLGLGCHLQNYVCELRGLEDDGDSVLILEGSGVPKIMIRAYNRRMDWPQLVANLAAASAGEGVQIGDRQ